MLEIKNLEKTYKTKSENITGVKNINLKFGNDGFVFLTGKSGSGKSTLLNLLGGLDDYDSGEIIIKGKSTNQFKNNDWDCYRNTYVGFVFQEFFLINDFTIEKNISLALELQGIPKLKINEQVDKVLQQVDLIDYKDRLPNELSGGQKQRIAIARALIKNPQIILCDEPTGNLDSETGRMILNILKKLSEGKLVIMVTHDSEFAHEYGDRIIELKDGEIIYDHLKNQQFNEINIFDGNEKIDKIIDIPIAQQLSKEVIEYIDEVLITSEDDLYIAISDKEFISDIVNLPIDQVNYDDKHADKETADDLNLKKATLTYHSTLKLAIDNLFSKKLRLVFTSVLFVFSLIFLGIALNLTFYDTNYSTTLAFKKTQTTYIPFTNMRFSCRYNGQCEYIDTSFSDSDIQELREQYDSFQFYKTYITEITFNEFTELEYVPSNYYYRYEFRKIGIIDNTHLELISGKYPTNKQGVLITDYMADAIIAYGVFDVVNIEDLVSKTFTYQEQSFTITGIVKTDIKYYYNLKSESQDITRLFYDHYGKYGQLFMFQETYDTYFKEDITPLDFKLTGTNQFDYPKITYSSNVNTEQLVGELPKVDNEIVVTSTYLNEVLKEDLDLTDLTDEKLRDFVGKTYSFTSKQVEQINLSGESYCDKNKEYKVVGIIKDDNQDIPYSIAFYDQELVSLKKESGDWIIQAMVVIGDNQKINKQLLEQFDDSHYRHLLSISDVLLTIRENIDMLQIVFYIIGTVFVVFTSFLIFAFISQNINYKKKEIGTLRALGARGIDVAKIFMTEGFIIIIFSSIIANILSSILLIIINNFIVKQFNLTVVLLYINLYSILLVFIIAFLIVLISTFIPIKRITNMKPINAIKDLK